MRNKFIALILVALAPVAAASVAEWKPFEEKVQEADAIIRGRVISTETRRDPSGQWLLTYTTLEVSDSLKGNAGSTITVVTPGGSENGLHQRTIGIPEFTRGDERILFTKNTQNGLSILYQDQGTYEVEGSGRDAVVVPATSDLILYDTQTGVVKSAEQTRLLSEFAGSVERIGRTRNRDAFQADTGPRGEARQKFDLTKNKPLMILLGIGLVLAFIPILRKLR